MAQALDWGAAEGITLAPDWRLQLAERMRARLFDIRNPASLPQTQLPVWLRLMEALRHD